MQSVIFRLKPLFATGIALLVVFTVTLFMGAANGSAGPETTTEPAVSPYTHVQSSHQAAERNEDRQADARETAMHNAPRR